MLWLRSVTERQADAERARLVRQVAYAGPSSTLPVERQQGPLVGQVVEVQCRFPIRSRYTGPQVEQRIRWQQGIECECVLGQRSADRGSAGLLERQHVDRTEAGGFVIDLGVVVTHVLERSGQKALGSGTQRTAYGGGGSSLKLRDARQPVAFLNARHDRGRATGRRRQRGLQDGIVDRSGYREVEVLVRRGRELDFGALTPCFRDVEHQAGRARPRGDDELQVANIHVEGGQIQ